MDSPISSPWKSSRGNNEWRKSQIFIETSVQTMPTNSRLCAGIVQVLSDQQASAGRHECAPGKNREFGVGASHGRVQEVPANDIAQKKDSPERGGTEAAQSIIRQGDRERRSRKCSGGPTGDKTLK